MNQWRCWRNTKPALSLTKNKTIQEDRTGQDNTSFVSLQNMRRTTSTDDGPPHPFSLSTDTLRDNLRPPESNAKNLILSFLDNYSNLSSVWEARKEIACVHVHYGNGRAETESFA